MGKDLQEIQQMGVDRFILNHNRSVISDNPDKIIEVSKQLSSFIRWCICMELEEKGLRKSSCVRCPAVVKSNIFISEPAFASKD